MFRLFDTEAEMHKAVSAVTGRHLAAREQLGRNAPAIAAIGTMFRTAAEGIACVRIQPARL